jgi:hypothetical protein
VAASCGGGDDPGTDPGTDPGSTDTWTAVADSKLTSAINAIDFGGGKFVAGDNGGKMAYSSNGTTWTAVGDSKFGSTKINAIAYGGGKFVAGGNDGKMAYSSDGTTWTKTSATSPPQNPL